MAGVYAESNPGLVLHPIDDVLQVPWASACVESSRVASSLTVVFLLETEVGNQVLRPSLRKI